jgi:hypothetical protein
MSDPHLQEVAHWHPIEGTPEKKRVAIGCSVGAVIETHDFIGFGTAGLRSHRLLVLSLRRAGRRRIRCGGVLGGEGRRARVRPRAGPRAGAERCDSQLRRPRLHRNRHHRRGAYGRAQGAARRPDPGRARRQRPRRRRPHHLPLPRGIGLHHRRHLRRQRRLAHPMTLLRQRFG